MQQHIMLNAIAIIVIMTNEKRIDQIELSEQMRCDVLIGWFDLCLKC